MHTLASSSISTVWRRRPGISLVLLAATAIVGCFQDPNIDLSQPRHCQADNNSCPWGYVCGPDQLCCASSNGKTCSSSTGGQPGSGGRSAGGSGGSPGVGGTTGGITATAGNTASGGITASGGTTASGGITASGGKSAGSGGGSSGTVGNTSSTGGGGVSVSGGGGGTGGSGITGKGGGTGGGSVTGKGGSGGVPASGGGTGSGGIIGTGGRSGTGGIPATGGAASGGGAGAQTTGTCTGATKSCNGSCIPNTSCCGGCSGNTPVCSNGTCVAKTIGDSCAAATECASGACSDGVCCDIACDGQCESCATTSSKGTCVPTTTARKPCTSDGTVCGGACDGTASHRKACVYPGASTSCGQAAQCNSASNQASTAEVCSGAGACNPATVTPCSPYRCRTDGSPTCATGCPSGQAVCGGSCVDILGSANHCGASCTACQGAKPKCGAGTCVQCVAAGDCPSYGYGAACSASNVCQCHPTKASNLVKNANFDSGLGGWTASAAATFNSGEDADECPFSGSVRTQAVPNTIDFGVLRQCVVVKPNANYYFGYDYMQELASGVMCSVTFYAGQTCSGTSLSTYFLSASNTTPSTSFWTSAWGSTTSAANAGSADVACQAMGVAWGGFDHVYLNPDLVGY